MDWFYCNNDTQRREVFCALLERAISRFPESVFPGAKRCEAAGYLAQLRAHATADTPPPPPRSSTTRSSRRPVLPPQLLDQLRTRDMHLRAFTHLQKLLLFPLARWWSLTSKQRNHMLAVEDTCEQSWLDAQHAQVLACAEATHVLDACFLQAELLLYVPLRAAMLAPFDPQPVTPEEEPQPLRDLEELRDSVSWRPFGKEVQILGNPLQGQNKYPFDLAFDCGVKVTERLIPDFDLISLMFVQASIEHALSAHKANDPSCTPYMQSFARAMIPQFELAALGEIRLGQKPPQMQRAIWSVMASMHKLCAWSGSTITAEAKELVRRTTTDKGGQTVPLDPRNAPLSAQVDLLGTGLLPPPSTEALLAHQQQLSQQQQHHQESHPQTQQQPRTVLGQLPSSLPASPENAAAPADGATQSSANHSMEAAAAAAAAPAAGEGKNASKNRKRREREKAAKAAAAQAALLGGTTHAGTAAGSTTIAACRSAPDMSKAKVPETPVEILEAAVKAEVNECCICLEPLTRYELLSCNVKTLYGPFHVLCTPCWQSLDTAECPFCRLEVESLSNQEFLERLGAA